ncbi:hypothetical protein [Paenibacillus pinihumi]|uniref:hypothetical protein n=1 Tax=Paenibacillus pinihumi TaxID=669462 RepID=UPI0012B57518|nr:hypothetical protein [Paenibacillus pinihumi]
MTEILKFLSNIVTVIFGGYIVLIILNRISFTFAIQYNRSNFEQVKDMPNEIVKDKELYLKRNKL